MLSLQVSLYQYLAINTVILDVIAAYFYTMFSIEVE